MPGALAALLAKMAGLGTAAKAAVATITAALTMTAAGGAAGVLPLPGGHTEVPPLESAWQASVAAGSGATSTPPTTAGGTALQAATATSVSSSTGSTSAPAGSGAATSKVATSVSVPPVTTVAGSAGLPSVSTVADRIIPAVPTLPPCVAGLIPAAGTRPDPTTLITQLPACILSVISAHLPLDVISRVIGTANLPVDISRCLSAVLRMVPTVVGGNLAGLSQLLSACLPTGGLPGAGARATGGSATGLGFGFGR